MAKLLRALSRTGVGIISLVLFVLSALSMWQFIYVLCNVVGAFCSSAAYQAFAELSRMFPAMLTALVFVGLSLGVFNIYRTADPNKRRARSRRQGAALMLCGLVIMAYIPLGRLFGAYSSFMEGYPSAFFPMDVWIAGIAFLLLGMILWAAAGTLTTVTCHLPGRCSVGAVFSYTVGCCAAAGCFWGIFTMDWTHGNLFFNVTLWLNYFSAGAMLLVYRYLYAETALEKRLPLGVTASKCFLIGNAVLLVLYLLAVTIEREAADANALSVMPLENLSGKQLFLPIFAVNNLLAPLVALIRCGWRTRLLKKKRKQQEQAAPPPGAPGEMNPPNGAPLPPQGMAAPEGVNPAAMGEMPPFPEPAPEEEREPIDAYNADRF